MRRGTLRKVLIDFAVKEAAGLLGLEMFGSGLWGDGDMDLKKIPGIEKKNTALPVIGDRVLLLSPHPWAGYIGQYVADEALEGLAGEDGQPFIGHKVRILGGADCFVTDPRHWIKL